MRMQFHRVDGSFLSGGPESWQGKLEALSHVLCE